MVECCVGGMDFGRVVDEGLVGYVVGVDFEFEVGLRVVGVVVDEGFYYFVCLDVIVGVL